MTVMTKVDAESAAGRSANQANETGDSMQWLRKGDQFATAAKSTAGRKGAVP